MFAGVVYQDPGQILHMELLSTTLNPHHSLLLYNEDVPKC